MIPMRFTAKRFQRFSSFEATPEKNGTAANSTAVTTELSQVWLEPVEALRGHAVDDVALQDLPR